MRLKYIFLKKKTFKEANSRNPISTESILSIFPSPVRSLKSRTTLLLSGSPPPVSFIQHYRLKD
jgi:hypothetical protein